MTLTQYLGDGKTHKIALVWNSASYDPTSALLIFTAKDKAEDLDSDARIQKVSGAGLSVVLENGQWYALVETVYTDTGSKEPCRLVWDIQAQTEGASPKTVACGTLTLIRDITREFTSSIPIFTSQPPFPGAQVGGTTQVYSIVADVAIGGGRFVHVGAAGLVYADSSLGLIAHGFVRAAADAGALASVEIAGSLNGLSGLVPGASYWLTTNGLYTGVPPLSGTLQRLGFASNTTTLQVNFAEPVNLS